MIKVWSEGPKWGAEQRHLGRMGPNQCGGLGCYMQICTFLVPFWCRFRAKRYSCSIILSGGSHPGIDASDRKSFKQTGLKAWSTQYRITHHWVTAGTIGHSSCSARTLSRHRNVFDLGHEFCQLSEYFANLAGSVFCGTCVVRQLQLLNHQLCSSLQYQHYWMTATKQGTVVNTASQWCHSGLAG